MRDEILKYLEEIRSHYANYHNHKETSAWAAVAVFMVFLAQIFRPLFQGEIDKIIEKGSVTVIIIALTIIIYIYLKKQFELRAVGAGVVAAAFYLKTELINKPNQSIDFN